MVIIDVIASAKLGDLVRTLLDIIEVTELTRPLMSTKEVLSNKYRMKRTITGQIRIITDHSNGQSESGMNKKRTCSKVLVQVT